MRTVSRADTSSMLDVSRVPIRPAAVLVAALMSLALLVCTGRASAETIHSPTPNTVAREDQPVTYDWAWDSDQYASNIIFANSADPKDPIWFGANNTGRPRVTVTDSYRTPFTSSNATFAADPYGITAGQWYWRLCSFTVDGEDDKCYFRTNPQPIRFTAKPAPAPVPAPSPAPAPAPAPTTTPTAPSPTKPAPQTRRDFSRTAASRSVRSIISQVFKYKRSPAARRIKCAAAKRHRNSCTVSWRTSRYRYRGTIRVSPQPFTAADIAAAAKNPTDAADSDWWYTGKITRTSRTSNAKKTIKLI